MRAFDIRPPGAPTARAAQNAHRIALPPLNLTRFLLWRVYSLPDGTFSRPTLLPD